MKSVNQVVNLVLAAGLDLVDGLVDGIPLPLALLLGVAHHVVVHLLALLVAVGEFPTHLGETLLRNVDATIADREHLVPRFNRLNAQSLALPNEIASLYELLHEAAAYINEHNGYIGSQRLFRYCFEDHSSCLLGSEVFHGQVVLCNLLRNLHY